MTFNSAGNVTSLTRNRDDNPSIMVAYLPGGDSTDEHYPNANPGALHNPSSICFSDKVWFSAGGNTYLAILLNSSVIFLQDTGTSWVYDYDISVTLPASGATYIYSSHSEGELYVLFNSRGQFRIDARGLPGSAPFPQDAGYEGKHILSEGLDRDGIRKTFFNYLDQDDLIFEHSEEGSEGYVTPDEIDSACLGIQDFHPFASSSLDNSNLVIVDCRSSSGRLRYVIAYDFLDNVVVRTLPLVGAAGGTPLGNGRYVAVRDGEFLSVIDIHGDTSATKRFSTPVVQMKFLTSGNRTILVIYRIGENRMLIDMAQFVSSGGSEGFEVVPNSVVTSRNPCQSVELINDYIIMAVYDATSSSYDIISRPLDFDSPILQARVSEVSTEPVIIVDANVQDIPPPLPTQPTPTSLPPTVTPSSSSPVTPAPTPGPTPGPNPGPTPAPASNRVDIVIGVVVASAVVGVVGVVVVIGCCFFRRVRRSGSRRLQKGAENSRDTRHQSNLKEGSQQDFSLTITESPAELSEREGQLHCTETNDEFQGCLHLPDTDTTVKPMEESSFHSFSSTAERGSDDAIAAQPTQKTVVMQEQGDTGSEASYSHSTPSPSPDSTPMTRIRRLARVPHLRYLLVGCSRSNNTETMV